MDRLSAMRAFVAVANLGSFAEAARGLRQSPSVITRQIAQLEEQLDLMLFSRTTRSVRLTERGRIFLESCRQILDDLEAAERAVRGESAAPRGELTVSAPITFGRLHVLPVVNALLAEHPALRIRLTLSDRNLRLAEDGIDVAVRIGALEDSSLMAVRLGALSQVVAAAPAYLARRPAPQTPAGLGDHDLIAFDGVGATNEWRFGSGETAVRVVPRLTVNSADAAVAAAEAGVGITRAMSYQLQASILAGRLVPILRAFAPASIPVSAVYPARRIASANVTAFVQAARAWFRGHPVEPLDAWLAP
jgi:DNA-binding transcriptional LysR family regulator